MATAPRIGTVFAGYRIESLLGRGGMSVVYRAENPRLGNVIALKLLAPELAEDESFRERFVRESRTAASISHPHIIPIYDAGDADGILYIAMRYVDGPDLKARARDGLELTQVVRIGTQIASALDAAHDRGLIHRDVKPANILLERCPGQDDHAYLADFGLTKNVESHTGITGSGHFVGTIDYMAPEQIEGREVDSRVDVYALGCVLFECLAGEPPYRRESDVAVLWAHMRDDPPSLSESRPDLPYAADAILAQALSKSPADRPESCGELADGLRAALGEPAGTIPARTVRVRRRRRQRDLTRNRALLVGLAGLILGAGIAAAALLPGRSSSTTLVTQTKVETRTRTVRVLVSRLRPLIPVAFRRECKQTEKLSPDYYETFLCHPGGGVTSVVYSLARGGTLMQNHFFSRLRNQGVPVFDNTFTSSGDCEAGDKAVRYWFVRNRKGGHNQATPSTSSLQIKGAVLCHHDPNRSWIEWTDNRLNVFAIATGRDPFSLYAWWAARGGPVGG
jgi:serine/threonine protein kinase